MSNEEGVTETSTILGINKIRYKEERKWGNELLPVKASQLARETSEDWGSHSQQTTRLLHCRRTTKAKRFHKKEEEQNSEELQDYLDSMEQKKKTENVLYP